MPSSKKVQRIVVQILPKEFSGVIYDLGSGWGSMVEFFSRRYPYAQVIGYEMSWVPFLISKLRFILLRRNNVQLVYKDFTMDRGAFVPDSWYYTYLFPGGMQKVNKMSLTGTCISNTFQLTRPCTQKIAVNDWYRSYLYIYNLPKSRTREN